MQQQKINNFYFNYLRFIDKTSNSREEKIERGLKFTSGYLAFSGLNFTYNITKNLFNKYVEIPRKELQILSKQNEIIIKNQEWYLRNQHELLRMLKQKS